MPKLNIPFNSFQFGETSPSFSSRIDSQLYQASAQKVRNFLVLSEGGVRKRPGTEYIYQFDNTVTSSNELEVRIEPFIFSDDERYIFAFSNNEIDIFRINPSTGAISRAMGTTNVSNCPWTTSILKELRMATSGDTMVVCHETFDPLVITRTGATTFTFTDFAFDTYQLGADGDANKLEDIPLQPYFSFQNQGVTLTPSTFSASTTATLTSSADYFEAGHVGTFLLIGSTPVKITARSSSTVVTVTIPEGGLYRELLPDSMEVFNGLNIVRITLENHGFTEGDSFTVGDDVAGLGGISHNNLDGAQTVSAVIDENTFEYDCGHSANSSAIGGGGTKIFSINPIFEWAEQSYSSLRGYPSAVTFHEGRLWFGGTTSQPGHVWASKSNNFFNFDIGTGAANDAIDLGTSFGEFSHIRHLVSNRDLQVFSASSESYIPSFTNQPITPSNAVIKRQTPFGSSYVTPHPFDGATLYVQASGKMLGSYLYSEVEQAYNTDNVSSVASHLMLDPVQSAYISGGFDRSESYIFLVNGDGTISVFYANRAEKKAGWMKWDTPGEFHSMCAVDRRLFCVSVRDEGDGTDRYYLEEFKEDMPMDFCKEYSGSASVFDVSSVFEDGATVKVVSGTDYLGEFDIDSDQEVDASAVKAGLTTAYIGYQFDPILETHPIDVLIPGQTMTGKPRKVNMVTLDLLDTLSVAVNDKNMILRNVNDDFSLDRSRFTGQKEFRLIGIKKDPTVKITQSVPFDLQVNGMVVEINF